MNQPLPPQFDANKRVAQYVALRDKIKAIEDKHKVELTPYKETLEQLNGVLLQHLTGLGADSIKTESGTVHITHRKSASIVDKSAFWTYVTEQKQFDLLDVRANATAVADHIVESGIVPGVNYQVARLVGVRRAS